MITVLAIAWSHCPPDPLLWLQLREPVLQLLYQPWLVLPLLGWITWRLSSPLPALGRSAAVLLPVLCVALLYSPLGTAGLTAWLQRQLPPSPDPAPSEHSPAIVVLLGRGPQVAGHHGSARITGDSCARTTWENATRTADWLRHHHPGSPVLLAAGL